MSRFIQAVSVSTFLLSVSAGALFAQATPDNFIVAVSEEPDTLDMTATGHAPGARVSLENITEGLWTTTTEGAAIRAPGAGPRVRRGDRRHDRAVQIPYAGRGHDAVA